MATSKINVRGVFFDNVTLDEAAGVVNDALQKDAGLLAVYTPNSEIVQMCIDDPQKYGLINSADLIIPDGVGVIKAAKILGTPLTERVPGVELGERALAIAAELGVGVYFLGGKPGVAEAAAEAMSKKYEGLRVVGTHDGYFKKQGDESDAIIRKINDSGASLLFVCLGVPVQEQWIFDNKEKFTNVRAALALGGSLDIYSGNAKRAPLFFRKTGLEWFYRLLCQPSRIGRMMNLPRFLFGTYAYKHKNKKELSKNDNNAE